MQNSHGEMSVQKDKTRRAFLKNAAGLAVATPFLSRISKASPAAEKFGPDFRTAGVRTTSGAKILETHISLEDATTMDLAARMADVVGGFEAPPGTYAL